MVIYRQTGQLIGYSAGVPLFHGMPVALGKNPVRLYPKLQNQPIGLPKIFIDYFFFQVDQWDCTKPLSIFDRLASSQERFRTFHCTNKLQSQPIGLPKIFIDYLFFQADQSDCTKSVSIFNRFASSEER